MYVIEQNLVLALTVSNAKRGYFIYNMQYLLFAIPVIIFERISFGAPILQKPTMLIRTNRFSSSLFSVYIQKQMVLFANQVPCWNDTTPVKVNVNYREG